MSWPWSTIGLPEQSTPAEIRAARQSWLEQQGPDSDPDQRKHIERAFDLALEIAEQRDPSHLHHSEFPDPWKDSDAPAQDQLPALRPEHPPLPSADMLATTVLGLVRQAPDFDAFAAALSRVHAWRDDQTRRGADGYLRDWLVDGGQLSPIQIVRLARAFDWTPDSEPLQDEQVRDMDWRRIVSHAHHIVAPPDPAYTGSIGRGFLMAGGIAAVALMLLLLPRVMAGGVRILIPIAFAALCAWLLIRWRR